MPVFIIYLIKLSLSLAGVYLFYQLVLRRLTFYNWNRMYLLFYTMLAFVMPFIDVTPVLEQKEWANNGVVSWVPLIGDRSVTTSGEASNTTSFSVWNIVSLVLVVGVVLMSIRLLIQLLSFNRMMRRSSLLHKDSIRLYQVDADIIPFSFGNSIFVNPKLHSVSELKEIIFHEFIHVKQRHSLDIIWGEVLCLLNWYNPFAWLLRRSIRQNLEFIADNKVLENGVDPKQYQYLLLKVIGNNHFSIASKFNFSSLKKRIAMMNKMKSAGVHLVKFLFILPIVAVLLIAFRGKQDADTIPPGKDVFPVKETDRSVIDLKTAIFTDTVRPQRVANSKGYLIDIKGVNGNCVVVVNNKEGKEVERILLTEWNNDQEKYEAKYGEILPPPPPPPGSPVAVEGVPMVAPVPPVPPVEVIGVPVTPLPCEEITAPLAALVTDNNFSRIGKEWEITKTRAWIKLKDGKEEVYDFTKPAEKAKFEKKYGRIIEVEELDELKAPVAVIGRPGSGGVTAYAPSPTGDEVVEVVGYTPKAGVIAGKDISHLITGNEDIIVTITKTSTRAQLDDFVGQMKAKGVELKFEDVEYEGNTLVRLTGTMKMNENQSNFVAVDFERLILAMIKKDGKTYFKVSTQDDKRVI